MNMVSRIAAYAAANVAFVPGLAFAQQTPVGHRYTYGPHMMDWGGGWYGMAFGPLFMILVLVAAIVFAILLARWLSGPPRSDQRNPLDILKERYARGEISKEQFEESRRVLRD